MPKINRQNILNNPNRCNYNTSFNNKVINENVVEFDDTLFIFFIISCILNIKLMISLSRNKYRINDKNKTNNKRLQTDPEFLSIIVNPDNEVCMLKK